MARRFTILAWVLGLVFALSTLRVGLFLDDEMQVTRASGALAVGSPWDLFRFSPEGDALTQMTREGPFPWWTLPQLRIAFFRPLSSALIRFDVEVFGKHHWLYHLHSVAWFALAMLAAMKLYRRLLPALPAALALVFFALDDAFWMPVTWLANRNALVAVTAALFGLFAHLRHREDGWKPGFVLAPLCFAASFAAGETAVAALAYVVAYELTRPRRQLTALIPLALVFIAWAVISRSLHYGTFGSAIYLDPLRQPLELIRNTPSRLSALLATLTLGLGSDWWMFLTTGRLVYVAVAIVGVALIWWLWRHASPHFAHDERASLRWLLLGSALSLGPVLATFPANRLLISASFGAMAVVSSLLTSLWPRRAATARGMSFALSLLVFAQAGTGIGAWLIGPMSLKRAGELVDAGVVTIEPTLDGRVVMPVAPDATVGIYTELVRLRHGLPRPTSWHAFSFAPLPHVFTRIDERRFELKVTEGRMLETVFEQLPRSTAEFPLAAGFTVPLDQVTVTVLDVDDGLPTRLQLDFALPLEAYQFVQWQQGRVVPLPLPAVGESVTLPGGGGPFSEMVRARSP